jgi:hypothetical protein
MFDDLTTNDTFELKQTKLPQMSALDNLIGSFQSKINDLKSQQDKVSKDETQLGLLESDPSKTYAHIEDALGTGLEILAHAKMLIESAPDADGIAAAASVMTAVQSMFKEFTSIWQRQINYQNAVNLEAVKLKNKKELEEYRMKLKLEYFNTVNTAGEIGEAKRIPFNTKDFIDSI